MLKSGRGGMAAAVVFVLLALAVAPGTAAAKPRPGSLDQSFGVGGRVTWHSKRQGEEHPWRGFQIAPLRGGGAIALASGALTRFEADGRRDRRFGRNGEIAVDEIDGAQFRPSGLAIDSKGRIVVAGTTVSAERQPGRGAGFAIPRESATVLRFTPSGRLDPSFGSGGVFSSTLQFEPPVFVPPGNPPQPPLRYEAPAVQATGVAIDAMNRPVLTGRATTRMDGCRDRVVGEVAFHESFVARLTAEGQPDPTFNGTGVRADEAQFSAEAPVVGRSDGVVYLRSVGYECENLGGGAQAEGVGEIAVDGVPKPAFGPDEIGGFQTAAAVAVDRRGRVLLLRDQFDWEGELIGPTVQVVRLLPSGSVDTSFGRNGTATVRRKGFVFSAIAADGHGRVLLAGDRNEGKGPSFGLVRLRSDGSPDRRFGHRGRVVTALGRHEGNPYVKDRGIRITVDRRDRILAGRYWAPKAPSEGSRFDMARFLPD